MPTFDGLINLSIFIISLIVSGVCILVRNDNKLAAELSSVKNTVGRIELCLHARDCQSCPRRGIMDKEGETRVTDL